MAAAGKGYVGAKNGEWKGAESGEKGGKKGKQAEEMVYAGGKGAGSKPSEVKPGDWYCKKCHAHNYAKRDACFTCGELRGEEGGGRFGAGNKAPRPICIFFSEGRCKNGDHCAFRHEVKEEMGGKKGGGKTGEGDTGKATRTPVNALAEALWTKMDQFWGGEWNGIVGQRRGEERLSQEEQPEEWQRVWERSAQENTQGKGNTVTLKGRRGRQEEEEEDPQGKRKRGEQEQKHKPERASSEKKGKQGNEKDKDNEGRTKKQRNNKKSKEPKKTNRKLQQRTKPREARKRRQAARTAEEGQKGQKARVLGGTTEEEAREHQKVTHPCESKL